MIKMDIKVVMVYESFRVNSEFLSNNKNNNCIVTTLHKVMEMTTMLTTMITIAIPSAPPPLQSQMRRDLT